MVASGRDGMCGDMLSYKTTPKSSGGGESSRRLGEQACRHQKCPSVDPTSFVTEMARSWRWDDREELTPGPASRCCGQTAMQ